MADSPFIEDPILRAKVLREYPYDWTYYDWCLTVLDIDPKIDLEHTPQWQAALERLCQTTSSEAVLWSRDLEQTHTVLVLAANASANSEEVIASSWALLDALLLCRPCVKHLVLNVKDYIPAPSEVHELILVEGNHEIVESSFLTNVDTFVTRTTPGISHEPAVELVSCIRGIAQQNEEGSSTIAILSSWVSLERRQRSIDPEQQSHGGATQYVDSIAGPVQGLKTQGAEATKYLLRLQWWSAPTPHTRQRHRCIIL